MADPADYFNAATTKNIVIGFVVFLAFGVLWSSFKIVNTGHRGVKTRFGKVDSESLLEGLYFVNPITTNLVVMDVREVKTESKTMAYTKDVQQVDVFYALNYNPDPTKIHVILEQVGIDWANRLIPQVVLGKIKEIVGHYEAVQLVSNRQEATRAIFDRIVGELAAKNVSIRGFELTNLDFNDQFEHAVESKVVAIQQAEEAKNKTVKVREEAEQKIISAKAEAESMRIRTQALSQNKGLVDYEAVQKWDGKLPETMMDSAVPFINLK